MRVIMVALLLLAACGPSTPSGPTPSGGSQAATTAGSSTAGSSTVDTGTEDAESEDTGVCAGKHGDENEADMYRCTPGTCACPRGQKCQPYRDLEGRCCVTTARCVDITGDKKRGEPCTRNTHDDDCDKDLLCIAGTSGKLGPGECVALCDASDLDSCASHGLPGQTCFPFNDGFLPLCFLECNPLESACPAGQGCYPMYLGAVCSEPEADDAAGFGEPCSQAIDCAPGLVCADPPEVPECDTEGSSCCTNMCALAGDASECAEGQGCLRFPWDAPVYDKVGFCGVESP